MTPKQDRIAGRVSAIVLLALSFTFALRGMQSNTSAVGEKPAIVCGGMACGGGGTHSGGGHGGGGGTIRVGP